MIKDRSILGAGIGCFNIIAEAESTKSGDARWVARCKNCGAEIIVRGTEVRSAIKNNAPLRICECERVKARQKKEQEKEQKRIKQEKRTEAGEYKHKYPLLYYTLNNAKQRCTRKTHPKYKDYGARGITVCNEWTRSLKSFCEWSMAHGYKKGLTLDRIDNDKGYSPDNCRWTTYAVQIKNRRRRRE